MRRALFLLVAMSVLSVSLIAQQRLPVFRVADTAGRYLRVDAAAFKKPVLLIYFLPDCPECQAFTGRLIRDTGRLRQYQAVMVTNTGLGALKTFAARYRLKDVDGLILGTEGWTNFLLQRLGAAKFPYVAVYDRHGMLLRLYPEAESFFMK